jgi:plasmid stabilization system protein ParE
MQLVWTTKAATGLVRLYEFLSMINKAAAASVVQTLTKAPVQLMLHPKIGQKVDGFDAREVRRILVGDYELRYELTQTHVYVLRIWHTRENR